MSTQDSPDTIFYKSLDRFKIGLTNREREDFELTSLDEVHTVVLEIQKEYASKRKMQNMARIESFLEGMEQYGNVIEVFLNVSMFVAFVWGPVKFLLQVAKTWTDSLDLLLNAYEQIGETIPQLLQYDALFSQNPAMQRVLGLIYQDILEFHRRALIVFKRRSWKQIFHSTWKTFNTHFNRLLQNLHRHKLDIERQASLIEIEQSQTQRESQEKQFLAEERSERQRQAITVIEKISPANFDLDQENISKHWLKEPEFGLWLLKSKNMEAWLDPRNLDANTLWLKGIPGAGKSELVSRVIAETRAVKPLVFFYCKYEDRSRNSLIAVLKAFLAQLIRLNPEVLSHIHEEVSKSSELTLETQKFLEKLVECALETSEPLWIIIDGLDECDKKEKKKIMSWFMSILEAEDCPGRLRLLVVSQDEGDIRRHLGKRPSKSLSDAPQHQKAIRTYASRKAAKIRAKLDLPVSTEREIIELVTNHSNGMFLFARLVLKHLKCQITLRQLEQELNPSSFPTELYEIYDRIYQRLQSNGARQREAAEKIISWVVCCKRALQWHEIQSMFAINLELSTVDFQGRRLRGVDVKDLCGSLIEMSSNRTIELVHHTAKSYLLDQSRPNMEPRVNLHITNLEIATTCLQYLCFHCFDGNMTDEEISNYVSKGYYSFQEFAIVYWLEYLQASIKTQPQNNSDSLGRLPPLIDKFIDCHLRSQQAVDKPTDTASSPKRSQDTHRTATQVKLLQGAWKSFTSSEKTHKEQDIFHFRGQLERRRFIFENTIIEIPSDGPRRHELAILYGDPGGWFRCSRIQCFAFHEGFSSPATRDTHEKKHQRNYRCLVQACLYSTIGFSSARDLKLHCSKNHPDSVQNRDAEFPQPINAETEPDTALSLSQFKGKVPSAASTYYQDEKAIKGNKAVENLVEKMAKLKGGDLGYRADIIAWPKRLSPTDDWVAVFNPNYSPRVDVNLFYTFQHTGPVECVCFSKDGKYLASGSSDRCKLFDASSGEPICELKLPEEGSNPYNSCRSLCFNHNGTLLASGWYDNTVRVWSVDSKGHCVMQSHLRGHTSSVYGIDFGNSNTFASCSSDGTVKLWDIISGVCLLTLEAEDGLTSVAISPDCRLVAAACLSKCAYVWDIRTGHCVATLKGHIAPLYSVAFMRNCWQIITASSDKSVMIWDIPHLDVSQAKHYEHLLETEKMIRPTKRPVGHFGFVRCAKPNFDDNWIVSGSEDKCIRFWNANTGACNTILKGHDDGVLCVASDPTGKVFATAGWDHKMRLWTYEEVPF